MFRRLANEITNECGLVESTQSAHLLLGVSPLVKSSGWDLTVRLTSMPLSARPWRVCNRPDALNATIAKAMIMLADPTDTGCFVNLGCGSGTLLAEQLLQTPSRAYLVLILILMPSHAPNSTYQQRKLEIGQCYR